MPMELGNMIFGNSRGTYEFPDRDLVDSKEWRSLLSLACDGDFYGYGGEHFPHNERGGVTTELFEINPYYWGECDCVGEEHAPDCPCLRHNFTYKPTGFWIDWYKYPFRDSYMSEDISKRQLKRMWKNCIRYCKYSIEGRET